MGTPQSRTSGKAITAMVLGIVGICILWIPILGWIPGILAIVFGFLGKKEVETSQGQIAGGGMAITGIVLGILQVVLIIVLLIVGVAMQDFLQELEQDLEETVALFAP